MKLKIKIIVCVSLLFSAVAAAQNKTTADTTLSFFKNQQVAVKHVFENLPVNATKPGGWIEAMMKQDLSQGFVGHLDELVPKIIKEDIYNTARRKSKTDIPNAGTQVMTGAAWEISMQWWGGETQGNWWDGFMRNAFLTNNKAAMLKVNNFVNLMIAAQEEDGYMGIYGKNLRYQQEGDNGELWTQTTLFRLLLGYYEMTGDKKVLQAVEKAMVLTISKYNNNAASPFKAKTDFGGLTHGLMMTDVCETLYRITGNKKYNDFAVYLYKEFSTYPNDKNYNDVRYEYLTDSSALFTGHGAHTYEHLRSLLLAYQTTGYPELKTAYNNALHKLSYCLLPGGAGIGDEWIAGKKANADSTAAEYCGMLELRNFYNSALQKTGDVKYADDAERLTFNDMQGTRMPNGKGITYCKTNNCSRLDYTSPHSGFTEKDPRYKYSPTHSDAAVCCNPNYGRNLPYYVSNMWMKAEDGLAAVLYGPSVLSTSINGVEVKINQQTNYPLSDKIDFNIAVSKPAIFSLYFRKPNWSKKVTVQIDGASVKEMNGYLVVDKKWKTGDIIHVSFENEVTPVQTFNNEIALQRGAIVFALAIPHQEKTVRDYKTGGFKDVLILPTNRAYPNFKIKDTDLKNVFRFQYVEDKKNVDPWYNGNIHLTGNVFNTETQKNETIKLVPLGSTILRKVTFKTN